MKDDLGRHMKAHIIALLLSVFCLVGLGTPSSDTQSPAIEPQAILAETQRNCVDLGCGCNRPAPSGCDHKCDSTKVDDECGICGGPGKTGCDNRCFSTKVADACGVCDGPGKIGCDPENPCDLTKEKDECGVCEGDGLSCVKRDCIEPVYEVKLTRMRYGSKTTGDNGLEIPIVSGDRPACLERILQNCQVQGAAVRGLYENPEDGFAAPGVNTPPPNPNAADDDCVAAHFLPIGVGKVGITGTGYVNAKCEIINYPGYTCGAFKINAIITPISFIWEQGASHQNQIAITDFPLDPSRKGWFHLWRASAKTPLLVYDPEHSGNITSARQLFGSFTFGKKWRNGYEALQFMDSDQDGTLKESELETLALWFDNNRNGVSEKGEVRTAKEMRVKEIYTRPDNDGVTFEIVPGSLQPLIEKPSDVTASRGFMRERDGVSEVLPSVDWYSTSTQSKEELLSLIQRGAEGSEPATKELVRNMKQAKLSSLSGAWRWKLSGSTKYDGGLRPAGMLTFADIDGEITGHSYLEIPLKENEEGAHSAIHYFRLKGKKAVNASGATQIEFEIPGANGAITKTTAILDDTQNSLSGTSTVGADAESPIAYEWSATKIIN